MFPLYNISMVPSPTDLEGHHVVVGHVAPLVARQQRAARAVPRAREQRAHAHRALAQHRRHQHVRPDQELRVDRVRLAVRWEPTNYVTRFKRVNRGKIYVLIKKIYVLIKRPVVAQRHEV